MTAPTRDELREHLLRTRIAGPVGTPRASNIGNIRKMLAQDPHYWFGIELDPTLNGAGPAERRVSMTGSHVEIWTVPTNEELVVARQARELLLAKKIEAGK